MIHPSREDWVAYQYNELPTDQRGQYAKHLQHCTLCAEVYKGIGNTATALDDYIVPKRRFHQRAEQLILKWAMAALLMIALGVTLGRLTAPKPLGYAAITKELTPVIRAEIRSEMQHDILAAISGRDSDMTNEFRVSLRDGVAKWNNAVLAASRNSSETLLSDLARNIQAAREEDQTQLLSVVRRLDGQRGNEIKGLRKDLETVAIVAESRLDQTQTAIGNLANSSLPSSTESK